MLLNEVAQQINVSDAEAEQLLHDVVATPSLSHQEHDVANLLASWMSAHGYDRAFVDEVGNAVGIIGSGSRDVVLLGHMDTFPGNPPVYRDGRLLYGRGSVDAKGPLCTFAVAALRAKLPQDVRVIVIGAVEEEAAISKGAHHAANHYQPAVCVIGEPSHWDRITVGYKGRILLDWRWDGAMAHSAGQTISPAEHAINYWFQVRDYAAKFNEGITPVFEQLTPSLRAINSGQDGAYGWAALTIGLRLPENIDPDKLLADLAPETGAITNAYGTELAITTGKDNVLTRAFRGAIRAHGGQPRFLLKSGTSDMNVVGHIWNCPMVAYGPGDSALDHTPDEHVDLDEYLRAIDVLASTLERL